MFWLKVILVVGSYLAVFLVGVLIGEHLDFDDYR